MKNDLKKHIVQQGIKETFEAKLIFVGDGGVGKTSLINRLINNDFFTDEIVTSGIAIDEWNLEIEINKKNENLKLKVWDFGGQSIYHSTHQFFLTRHSIYVFVWEARKNSSLSSFDYWLNAISILGESSPILVVQNKIDERLSSIDQKSLAERFPNIVGFYQTSVKSNIGISELQNSIVQTALSLPHIGNKIPSIWDKFNNELHKLSVDYLFYENFIDIGKKYGINEENIVQLSSYYHDLGTFLHFSDDLVLKEIVVLNPSWITHAMYILLDSKKAILNYGILKTNEIQEFWNSYEKATHKYLIRFLLKFELAFRLDDELFIIPNLLPIERPEFNWDYSDNSTFEYSYDFMPAGIITRFICRVFDLAYNNLYWKSGIVLINENTKALVISQEFDRTIKVYISGENKPLLLSVVRQHFDYINQTFSNLQVRNLIPCLCDECRKSKKPYHFDLSTIEKFERKGLKTIQCAKSFGDISISELLKELQIPIPNVQMIISNKKESITFEWNENNNLNFEYHYKFNKGDILEKFQSRIANILNKENQWSNGLIVEREGNKALVLNDVLKNNIKISICGIDNLEFLSVLRYEFEYVYRNHFNNNYIEVVKCICKECVNSNEPHFFDFHLLRKRKSKGKDLITCPKSAEDVSLGELFGVSNIFQFNTEFSSNTIIENVNINNSDSINLGGLNKSEGKMKINKIINKGGQNVFSDSITNSKFEYSEIDRKLLDFFSKYSESVNEKEELEKDLKLINENVDKEKKMKAKERIESFLYKHSSAIGDSIVASTLFELGKQLLT